MNRWHGLLDEYSALGPWLSQATLGDAVATLSDLASERNFDAASVEAPVTLTDLHDDPCVHYDGICCRPRRRAMAAAAATRRSFRCRRRLLPACLGERGRADSQRARIAHRGVPAPGSWSAPGHASKGTRIDRKVRCSPICLIVKNSFAPIGDAARRRVTKPALESFDDTQGVAVNINRLSPAA